MAGTGGRVRALAFGHTSPVEVRRDLLRRLRPPSEVLDGDWSDDLRARLQAYATGDPIEFSDVEIDASSSPFRDAVVAVVRGISRGDTMTYGEVAAAAGFPGAARAVGQVMAGNPVPLIVPCHRVIGAGGRLGGYSARTGLGMKRRLLAMERAAIAKGPPRSPGGVAPV